ncbi:MAG: RNA polymerase sigma factor [Sphingobacteriales bacterium]|nr:RNA polymerase sigma factor [Sphingobacteriales bacterium]
MFLSDEEIVLLFRDKNRRSYAFTQLLEKYKEKVYWLIRRMVQNHEDANDLTQEVFIKIWRKIDDFRGESKLFTWIYRISVNMTISFLNKSNTNQYLPDAVFENITSSQVDHSPQEDGGEILKKLHNCVKNLPEKQQLVFQLRYFEELSYEEIAEITNTSVGALKANYHHAVKKIEHYLFIPD